MSVRRHKRSTHHVDQPPDGVKPLALWEGSRMCAKSVPERRETPVILRALAVERNRRRQPVAAKAVTVGALLTRYRQEVLPRKKTRTQTNQGQHMAWWTQTLGARPVAELTPARLAACRDQLARERSAGTVNQYLRTLSHALSVAVREWGWLESNPLRRVPYLPEPPRPGAVSGRSRAPETPRGLPSERQPHALPGGDISAGLTWPQVVLWRALVTLHDTKNGTPRSILVTGQALDVMRAHAKVIRLDTLLVFPWADGLRPMDIRYAWSQALKQAEIANFRFHDLRHLTASYLAMNEARLVEIAEVLGHKTLKRRSAMRISQRGTRARSWTA